MGGGSGRMRSEKMNGEGETMADYNKVGLLTLRGERILLCRKKHSTSKLILPGGCLEEGETPLECLARELREELGEVAVEDLEYLGTYRDRAASDDPAVEKTVEVQLFKGELVGEPAAAAEIKEVVWFGPESDPAELAPSLVNKILPDLLKRGILPWGAEERCEE